MSNDICNISSKRIDGLEQSARVAKLKDRLYDEDRYMSIEQARIVTEVYQKYGDLPRNILRARALYETLERIDIRIDPGELIVGNRTVGVRSGVVFPESGLGWVDDELDDMPTRPQDPFLVHTEDVKEFRESILPFWRGKTLEDYLADTIGDEMSSIGKVAKINQTDHAQGHICPDTREWLMLGPLGIADKAVKMKTVNPEQSQFYEGIEIVMKGAGLYMHRYAELASKLSGKEGYDKDEMAEISAVCSAIAERPPRTFREALQSVWFLFVLLQMESNASSFSPGRMDQYLYPYYKSDIENDTPDYGGALELIECLFIKFNQIVYMRSSGSAQYFAGFPIGFNVAIGGQDESGGDSCNELTYLLLKAQEHLLLPQPNLSARVHNNSPVYFLRRCAEVIGKGSGMPQLFNDEAVIPALEGRGIAEKDARNYAIVGCVELTTMGNNLGWSDAAMFNLVKALELALNDGKCMLTGKQMGAQTGSLADHETYEDVERAFMAQIDFFMDRMIRCCEKVEKAHADLIPSPFLSGVIDSCMEKGIDVTAGGALYNLSGIQAIQCANVADCLAALKTLVYDDKRVNRVSLHEALLDNFNSDEFMRLMLINKAPKYGNDVEWVDLIAEKWVRAFAEKLEGYTNLRGGVYHMGLYTVSAHVPMGLNVGATPDGRKAKEPLADGGMSAMYGRDINGPTALLHSVSRIMYELGSNGTLLNMKFLPSIFSSDEGIDRFVDLIKAFIKLKIIHVQFNVINRDDLINAQERPELFRSLTVRVAGYTAYFVELDRKLQDEIISRTSYDLL